MLWLDLYHMSGRKLQGAEGFVLQFDAPILMAATLLSKLLLSRAED